jgi:hypothetical protein
MGMGFVIIFRQAVRGKEKEIRIVVEWAISIVTAKVREIVAVADMDTGRDMATGESTCSGHCSPKIQQQKVKDTTVKNEAIIFLYFRDILASFPFSKDKNND